MLLSSSPAAVGADKFVNANCLSSDLVGNFVYISGPSVAGVYQTATVDPTDGTKMPAFGMIVVKNSPTDCIIQLLGEAAGFYTGLTTADPVFVGLNGRLSLTPPTPPALGYAFVQIMGLAVDSNRILLLPNFAMTKRIG